MTQAKTVKGRVQSVERGIHLLRVLSSMGGPAALKDISAAANLAPAMAHRYLASFIATGMVDQTLEAGHYRLGPMVLHLGLSALAQTDLYADSATPMQLLRDRLNEAVLLSVWGNNGPTIIKMLEPVKQVTVNVRVGFSLPLLSSATGLVFTAFLAPEVTRKAMELELALHRKGGRPGAPADLADVQRQVNQVRRHGVSCVKGALLAGINSMAAPIFDHRRQLVGVLTVVGSADQINIAWSGTAARMLKDAAAEISYRLGFTKEGTSERILA